VNEPLIVETPLALELPPPSEKALLDAAPERIWVWVRGGPFVKETLAAPELLADVPKKELLLAADEEVLRFPAPDTELVWLLGLPKPALAALWELAVSELITTSARAWGRSRKLPAAKMKRNILRIGLKRIF
jgi:hypothetical protein